MYPCSVASTSQKIDPNKNYRPKCTLKVGEIVTTGVIDTRAHPTILQEAMIKVKVPTTSFAMADKKTTLFAKGPKVAKFELNGAKFEHPIYTQTAKEAIIGADFLHANKAIIDMERGTIEFKAKPKQIPQLETTGKANLIETMVRSK